MARPLRVEFDQALFHWVKDGIQKGHRFNAAEFTALAREHSIRHVEVFNIFHDPPEKSVRRLLKGGYTSVRKEFYSS